MLGLMENYHIRKYKENLEWGPMPSLTGRCSCGIICVEDFIQNPVQIGGPGRVVEIDEGFYTAKI